MKKILVLFTIISLFYSCSEEEIEDDYYHGKVSYYKNNAFKENICALNFIDDYYFKLWVYNDKNELREELIVEGFDIKAIGVEQDSIVSKYYTLLYDGDVLQSTYRLDPAVRNYFIIDNYNESTGDISGRFQLTMSLYRWNDYETEPEFDTIHFTQGQFETRINYLD